MDIKAKTVTGKVVGTKRAGTSTMGNPSYDVQIAIEAIDGIEAISSVPVMVRTATNSGIAYGIENPEFRNESHTFNLNRYGKIESYVR